MSEALSAKKGRVTPERLKLYTAWAKGGLACAIAGNFMVNWRAKNEPGVVLIEDGSDLPALMQWANLGMPVPKQ
jgi:2,4-dienoyl-CoA reductase-like NADH-dependent reductase (Old Yellow Enzyme family)